MVPTEKTLSSYNGKDISVYRRGTLEAFAILEFCAAQVGRESPLF
jgi:hypothetical protein